MNKRWIIVLGACLAVGIAMLGVRRAFQEILIVDACYDGGGVYLNEIDKCSHSRAEIDRYRRRAH